MRDPRLPQDMEVLGEFRNDPVVVVPPDEGWPAVFASWRWRLAAALGTAAVRIDHVGSTAVPGLAAKPVVDIQVSVRDVEDESTYVPAIESLGLRLRSREPGHRYFRPPPGMSRDVQVHVCQAGSAWELDHLRFRDYLCAHPDRAAAYGALKADLAARHPQDRIGYTQAKGPFIAETLRLALAEAHAGAPPPSAPEPPERPEGPEGPELPRLSGEAGAVVPGDVLANARRVGPDVGPGSEQDAGAETTGEPEFEPWDVPPPPPRAPRLREHSVDEVFARIAELTLGQARAFLRAYLLIPRSELEVGGSAPAFGASEPSANDPATLDQVVAGRAMLRQGAIREARANGAQVDADPLTTRASQAVVEALSHASLRGGGLEEATVAAELAAQDTALALSVRPWISEWRFQELVEPWVKAYSVIAVEAHAFDVLGAIALGFGVIALVSFGIGRTSLNAGDGLGVVFAVLTAAVLVIRWQLRRQPAPP